ncbi:MAG TPA: UbiD family decarboxylase, partial [Chloroflexota bacterium]|nr:UbiD family decarboxylase [Chloroflexota bacterium]
MSDVLLASDPTSQQIGGYPDLRDWLRRADEIGQLRRIDGADWRLEIGALTEMFCRRAEAQPCLVFDNIKDYPPGWRVVANSFGSQQLAAMALKLPPPGSYTDLVQAWRAKSKQLQPLPVRQVDDGPILENVLNGPDVDLYRFPTPLWHEEDGGRYIGTGSNVITR